MREKLIELMRKAVIHGKEGCDSQESCDECPYRKFHPICLEVAWADFLIDNGVTIQKWIPVTERLPEELKNVLAYTDVGSFAETAHWTGYRWEKTWDFEVLYGVTHWMPLPEAPNGERRTDD